MPRNSISNNLHYNWPELIARCEQSGLSRSRFCKDNDLVLSQFNYYCNKFKKQDLLPAKSALVPITVKSNPPANVNLPI